MTSLFLVKLKKRWPDESESQRGGWRFKKKREVIKTLKKNRLSELFENTVEAENHAIQLVPIFTFVWNFSQSTEQCGFSSRKGEEWDPAKSEFFQLLSLKDNRKRGLWVRKRVFEIWSMGFNLDGEGSDREIRVKRLTVPKRLKTDGMGLTEGDWWSETWIPEFNISV